MGKDECRIVDVDGEPIRVQASGEWTEEDHAAFEEIVRAAKRRYEREHRCRHCGKPPEADGDHSCPCPHTDADCPTHPPTDDPDAATARAESEASDG